MHIYIFIYCQEDNLFPLILKRQSFGNAIKYFLELFLFFFTHFSTNNVKLMTFSSLFQPMLFPSFFLSNTPSNDNVFVHIFKKMIASVGHWAILIIQT